MNTVTTKAAMLMAALLSGAWFCNLAYADDQTVEQRVDALERQLNQRNAAMADMQQQLDDLNNEVRQLRGTLEEANYKLDQSVDRQKSMYLEMDKLKSASAASSAPQSSAATPTNAQPQSAQASVSAAPASNAAAQPTASQPPSKDESQAYDAAVNLVMKDKNYAKATPAFQAFIQKYPQSGYVPNAHYWLGQLLFSQGDKEQAKNNFLIVAQKYKDSPKRADALLKLGMITQGEGDKDKAAKFFQLVIKQYPNTPSAQLAQKALTGK